MKDFSELNPRNYHVDLKTECHLKQLFGSLLLLQDACGIDFVITSGLRSMAYQNTLIATGKSNAKASKHLIGAAADLHDPDKKLAAWCKANEKKLEELELWCEDPDYTKDWLHVQTLPPKSGRRFFIP